MTVEDFTRTPAGEKYTPAFVAVLLPPFEPLAIPAGVYQ
jgi:hypothetical protein